MDIVLAYQQKVKSIGRAVEFTAAQPEMLADIPSDALLATEYLQAPVWETEIQNVPILSEKGTNTSRIALSSTGQHHIEGGWPRDVDADELEHKTRYRRKAEKEESYFATARSLLLNTQYYLRQNNAINIYESYFGDASASSPPAPENNGSPDYGAPASPTSAHSSAKLTSSSKPAPVAATTNANDDRRWMVVSTSIFDPLLDPSRLGQQTRRMAWSASWHPHDASSSKVAVAWAHRMDEGKANASQLFVAKENINSYVYDLTKPHSPEMVLTPPSPVIALEYCGRDMNLIAAGCLSGCVCVFDTRRAPKPVVTTNHANQQNSLSGKVSSVRWMAASSKTQEIISVNGTSGVQVWDIKKMSEPIDTVRLIPRSLPSTTSTVSLPGAHHSRPSHGGLCIDYSPGAGGPTRFSVGTDSGFVFTCTRRGRNDAERVLMTHAGHFGPVSGIQRNQFVPKLFVTAGDWAPRIWHDDVRHPLISLPFATSYAVDVSWHPLRPSVFAVALADGRLQVWDLLHRHDTPLCQLQVCADGLQCAQFNAHGTLIFCGGCGGHSFVVRLLPEFNMASSYTQMEEKLLLVSLVDRELGREYGVDHIAAKQKVPGGADLATSGSAALLRRSLSFAGDGEGPDLEDSDKEPIVARKMTHDSHVLESTLTAATRSYVTSVEHLDPGAVETIRAGIEPDDHVTRMQMGENPWEEAEEEEDAEMAATEQDGAVRSFRVPPLRQLSGTTSPQDRKEGVGLEQIALDVGTPRGDGAATDAARVPRAAPAQGEGSDAEPPRSPVTPPHPPVSGGPSDRSRKRSVRLIGESS